MAGKGMGLVKDESMSGGFEKGGKVKKDHPHYKYLKDLDEFMARQFPKKGKKVEVDAEKKSFKAIGAKKGSIEPVKLQKGVSIDLSNKALDKKLLTDLDNPNSKLNKLIKKVQQGNLDKADLEAAKELGYKPKQSKKIGTGVDYNPLSGIANFLKGLVTPKKKVDAKALLKKKQDEKDFRKKAGDKEVLGQFRRDLEREKKAC